MFPPLPASIVMFLIYVSSAQVLPLAEVRALFAGGVLGYITYEMVHYYLHHGSPPPGSFLARHKSYHVAHHYINPDKGNSYYTQDNSSFTKVLPFEGFEVTTRLPTKTYTGAKCADRG